MTRPAARSLSRQFRLPVTAQCRPPAQPSAMRLPVDHLIYATRDLDRGMEEIERVTGIAPALGGRHPGRGTRNALVSHGADVYLEIIAPDPDQPPPTGGRWVGVDRVNTSRLTTWAAKSHDLEEFWRRAAEQGVQLGEIQSGSRQRADCVTLAWRLTDPEPLVADGVVPFFIDWGSSPHPARSAAQGASLVSFHVEHDDATGVQRMLRALGLDVTVVPANRAALVAVIDSPRGRVELR